MGPRNYRLLTTCINAKAQDIESMTAQSREVTYTTIREKIGAAHLKEIFQNYEWNIRAGLTLKNDYYVKYFTSTYRGKKCCYIAHSNIEYVFTQQK